MFFVVVFQQFDPQTMGVFMATHQNRHSQWQKRRPSAIWTMREMSRRRQMGKLVFLSQGGRSFFVYWVRKTSRTLGEYSMWAKSDGFKLNFLMTVTDDAIVVTRQDGNNAGDDRITGFYVRGVKGSWSLGRSDD